MARLQGQLDFPLTEQGVAHAHMQKALMPEILAQKPDICVSPLGRAVRTAQIALGDTPYRTDPRLMEIDVGDWEGRYRKDIIADHPHWAEYPPSALALYGSATNGEGIARFQARIVDFLRSLNRPTVIVAHGMWGQVARAHLCGLSLDDAGRQSNLQGVVYVLENGTETLLGHDA